MPFQLPNAFFGISGEGKQDMEYLAGIYSAMMGDSQTQHETYPETIFHLFCLLLVHTRLSHIQSPPAFYDQHPSFLGHVLIAENILFGLFPSNATSRSYNVSTCGVDWKDNGESKNLYANTQKCTHAYSDNIRWLRLYLEVQPTSYLYDYYKSRSERDLMASE